jgi:hypothetical protein
VVVPGKPLKPIVMKQSSLLGSIIMKKKIVLNIHNTLFSFVTYEWAQLAGLFVPGKPFKPSAM